MVKQINKLNKNLIHNWVYVVNRNNNIISHYVFVINDICTDEDGNNYYLVSSDSFNHLEEYLIPENIDISLISNNKLIDCLNLTYKFETKHFGNIPNIFYVFNNQNIYMISNKERDIIVDRFNTLNGEKSVSNTINFLNI